MRNENWDCHQLGVGCDPVRRIAYAAIPSADGTVYACYNTGSLLSPKGTVRVVENASSCNSWKTRSAGRSAVRKVRSAPQARMERPVRKAPPTQPVPPVRRTS